MAEGLTLHPSENKREQSKSKEVTRRGFLKGVGAMSAGLFMPKWLNQDDNGTPEPPFEDDPALGAQNGRADAAPEFGTEHPGEGVTLFEFIEMIAPNAIAATNDFLAMTPTEQGELNRPYEVARYMAAVAVAFQQELITDSSTPKEIQEALNQVNTEDVEAFLQGIGAMSVHFVHPVISDENLYNQAHASGVDLFSPDEVRLMGNVLSPKPENYQNEGGPLTEITIQADDAWLEHLREICLNPDHQDHEKVVDGIAKAVVGSRFGADDISTLLPQDHPLRDINDQGVTSAYNAVVDFLTDLQVSTYRREQLLTAIRNNNHYTVIQFNNTFEVNIGDEGDPNDVINIDLTTPEGKAAFYEHVIRRWEQYRRARVADWGGES